MADRPRPKRYSVHNLLQRTSDQLLTIWKTLPPPDFNEMDGEYSGYFPHGDIDPTNPEVVRQRQRGAGVETGIWPGFWLGKCFKAKTATRGEGYNCWRHEGVIIRHTRFAYEIRKSLIDGKPALVFYYSAFNNEFGLRDTTDEIRKLDDGIYVVAATSALPDGKRSPPGAFILAGPTWPWVGPDDETAEQF